MAETFRPPKAVLRETDLPATLTPAEVLALRDHGGETGAWAERIALGLESRAAIIQERPMLHTRAEGADIPVADALAALLLETFEVYVCAHRAHWNVSGQDFAQYHDLFGAIAGDVYDSVDPLAENIRKVGSLVPALVVVGEESRDTDPVALAMTLLDENEELLLSIRAAFDIATAAGQQGIANFLADRQDAHAKWSWQLRSSLGVAEVGAPVAEPMHDDEDGDEGGERETNGADPDVEARRSLLASADKRTFTTEVRAAMQDDGTMRLRGYAAKWDTEADGLPFREVIKRGAFGACLERGDDVFLLVNHDTDQLPLARRSAGTLTVTEDDTGLLVEAVLDPNNPRAAELASALSRGDVDKMSFAFKVAKGGEVRNDDGLRELRALDLFEVSVVTWPAYSATEVGLREASDDDAEHLALRWKRARLRHAAR